MSCCRCQTAPDGGSGRSAFNLRAWGAGLMNNLRLGFMEQQQRLVSPPAEEAAASAPDQDAPAPGQQREGTATASSSAPELHMLTASAAEDEASWENWQEVQSLSELQLAESPLQYQVQGQTTFFGFYFCPSHQEILPLHARDKLANIMRRTWFRHMSSVSSREK